MMPRDHVMFRILGRIGMLVCLVQLTACVPQSDRQHALIGTEDDRDGSGIGGTGIRGVITDFGSVIVNGLHVDYVADTPIFQDGEVVAAEALELGQVVAIDAFGDQASLSAQSIDIRREVLGPISDIDPAADSITVLDQRVVLAKDVEGDADMSPGQMVAVSGLRLPDGRIFATRIDNADAGEPVHLYGTYAITGDAASSVEVGGLEIEGLAPLASLAGREIFVRGRLIDGRMIPIQVQPQPEAPFGGRFDRLSIAGFIDRDTMTLGTLGVTELPDGISRLDLSEGLSAFYGVFEGKWSQDRALFDIESKSEGVDPIRSIGSAPNDETRQDLGDQSRDRRDGSRERGRDSSQDRGPDRDDREGRPGGRR